MQVKRSHLCLVAALIWGLPGVMLTLKGALAYGKVPSSQVVGLLLITVATLLMFYRIFNKMVKRYAMHIATLPEPILLRHTFPPRGWCILLFMMSLGVAFKFIPGIPLSFTASFYSGLGPMLIWSAICFLSKI